MVTPPLSDVFFVVEPSSSLVYLLLLLHDTHTTILICETQLITIAHALIMRIRQLRDTLISTLIAQYALYFILRSENVKIMVTRSYEIRDQ